MPRRPRRVLPSYGTFHVIARGVDKTPIFRERDDYIAFLRRFALVAERWDWSLYAFCLMTTHYHIVLRSGRDAMSRGVHRLSGAHAEWVNGRYGREGHLFGDCFSSRLVESEGHLFGACRYVLLNPVRAGLCERAADWPWSWCRYGRDVD